MTEKCLEYTFDEINIGLTKEFEVVISESMVKNFAEISGDFSPIHIDEKYAEEFGIELMTPKLGQLVYMENKMFLKNGGRI